MAYKDGFYVVGFGGGWCCPPQMGNQGLSCDCRERILNGGDRILKKNNFPFLGMGAPAHEMAHYFIKHYLFRMVKQGLMELPEFINSTKWSYKKPFNGAGKCAKAESDSLKWGPLWDFLWNSREQDGTRNPPASKIEKCKSHHYFIYSGQEKYLFKGNAEIREKARKRFHETNPNLHNLMAKVWPCNNDYIAVCKDGSYGFTLGLSQKLKIGIAESEGSPTMKCMSNLDHSELEESEIQPLKKATVDFTGRVKCLNVAKKVDKTLGWQLGNESQRNNVPVDAFEEKLKRDDEFSWFLRKCCSKTAKFNSAM